MSKKENETISGSLRKENVKSKKGLSDFWKDEAIKRKKEIFENVDDEGNIKVEKKSLLQTSGLDQEKVDTPPKPSGGFISTHQLKDGKLPQLLDYQFVQKHIAEIPEKEIKKLRTEIEKRLSEIPPFTFWRCSNKGCSHPVQRSKPDAQGGPCIHCNWAGMKNGGQLVRMSKKEVETFLKWEAEEEKKAIERMKKADFENTNQKRRLQGLDPLTREEFDAQRKREWELENERRNGLYRS